MSHTALEEAVIYSSTWQMSLIQNMSNRLLVLNTKFISFCLIAWNNKNYGFSIITWSYSINAECKRYWPLWFSNRGKDAVVKKWQNFFGVREGCKGVVNQHDVHLEFRWSWRLCFIVHSVMSKKLLGTWWKIGVSSVN